MMNMPQNILVSCVLAFAGLAGTQASALPCSSSDPAQVTVVMEEWGFYPDTLYFCDTQKIYVRNRTNRNLQLQFTGLNSVLNQTGLLNAGQLIGPLSSPISGKIEPISISQLQLPTGEVYQCGWTYFYWWRTPKYCNVIETVTEIQLISDIVPGTLVLGPPKTSYEAGDFVFDGITLDEDQQ